MVKVYSLDQLNQVFTFIQIAFFHFEKRWVLRDFRPWVQPLLAEWSTTHCLAGPLQLLIMWNISFYFLRVSPAPAPRSILVKKVTFQRREGESSSGSRFNMTCLYPLLSIPPQTIFQPSSGGSLGASQSGYLDMASLREDIAGSIVREPPPYPRYSVDTLQWCVRCLPKWFKNYQARIREVQCYGPLALVRDFQTCFNKYIFVWHCWHMVIV